MSLPVLKYFDRIPPYAVIAAAAMAQVPIELRADGTANKDYVVNLTLADGEVLQGLGLILRYLARAAPASAPPLYGSCALEACRIDQWIEFSTSSLVSGPTLQAAVSAASDALALHTFMAGYQLSIADLCAWGMLHSAPMWQKVKKAPEAGNLLRWFEFCNGLPHLAAALAAGKGSGSKAASTAAKDGSDAAAGKKTDGGGSFDIGLPGAKKGAVVTRFPPEPSGYLHIGHTKAALLNQYFADTYEGKLLVRFDDTNPSKESTEFVDNIVDDMKRLGLRYERISYTSEFFPELIETAKRMIEAGSVYADDTDVESMREERKNCVPSRHRDMPAAEAARVFEEMLKGSEEGVPFCLRVKMDMANENACLRDPVIFRCNSDAHWRTGRTYLAYPTYDFACPYVDSKQGVTHALRTSEYKDREEQYQRMLKLMQAVEPRLPGVHIWDFSRLNFVHTVLSKRKLQKLVDTGVVDGWTDPRFPTVQGILRRGMQVAALKEFILLQGASKNTTLQEWDKIWTINKKVIDPVAPRHTGLVKAGLVPVHLSNGPEAVEFTTVLKHKKNADVGSKTLYKTGKILVEQSDAQAIKEGEEVTLMDWGNCIMRSITKDAAGAVTRIDADLHLAGDFKKTKWKLTWLADVPELVPLRLVQLGNLITKSKLEEEDSFDDFVNRESWQESSAFGDANMRALQAGDIIQLERKGFYRVDQPMVKPASALLLFEIPDGRQRKP